MSVDRGNGADDDALMEKLHHVERGSGPPVVLLHGFPLDSRVWESQLKALGDRRRVIAVDMQGFGNSKSQESFEIEGLARGIHEYLTSIGALPCVLGGLSMGGYVALAFAQMYPTDLKGLMLIDTKAEGDGTAQREGRMKMIELVRSKGPNAVAEQMMPKMLAESTIKANAPVVGKLREIMEACPAKTIEHALLAMRDREDRTGMLASLAMPVLIVVGEMDAITPPSVAEAMKKEMPHARVEVIKGAGHMAVMEKGEDVNRAMKGFLEECVKG
jgi:3-oxoadipate enol-lactonase